MRKRLSWAERFDIAAEVVFRRQYDGDDDDIHAYRRQLADDRISEIEFNSSLIGVAALWMLGLQHLAPPGWAHTLPHPALAALVYLLPVGILALPIAILVTRNGPWHYMSAPELRVALSHLHLSGELSPLDEAYVRLLVQLAQASPNALRPDQGRAILKSANRLLEKARELGQCEAQYKPQIENRTEASLEASIREYEAQLMDVSDPVTCNTINQTIEAIRQQLSQTGAMVTALERIARERQLLIEKLLTWEGAVARRELAPKIEPATLAEQASDLVSTIDRETGAIEQAVEEILVAARGA